MSDTESTSKKPKQYTSVIKQKDIKRYEEMGLGRGVDVTDPKMWRNKSSFIVRTVCPKLSNITGTDEGCMKEKYEKEVSTVAMHQQKIRLSLEEPVKIAIDAHSSQSTSSAKTISGTKVTTSTIAFKVNLKALKVDFEESNAFEDELYSWILSCIESRDTVVAKKLREDTAHDELASSSLRGSGHGDKANDKLATSATLIKKLEEIGEDKNKNRELVNDCTRFVVTYGVTHYISAIKLGAMLYRVASAHTKQTTLGAGAEVGGRGMAVRGAMSRSKHIFKKFEAEQEIGRIGKDGQVEKENEAVIGCQILPVYKLVKIPLIQKKLQEAIKEYIQIKEEKRGNLTTKLFTVR